MPKLVLFEAYGTKKPETRSDGVEGKALVTAAKLTSVMKPDTVHLSVQSRKAMIELVKGKERVQITGNVTGNHAVFDRYVDAKAFTELAKVKADTVEVNVNSDSLSFGSGEIPTVEGPEHAPMSVPRKTASCQPLYHALVAAGEHVGVAERYDFDKVLLDPDGTDIRVVSSDKSTMYHAVLKNVADTYAVKKPILLPWSKVLTTPVFAKTADIRFACSAKAVTLTAGDVVWQHDVELGRFPLYREVVEKAVSEPSCHIAGESLGVVFDKLKEADKKKEKVALLFSKESGARLFIGEKDANLTLPVSGYAGDPLKIAFTPKYLKRGLSVEGLKTVSVPEVDYRPVAFNNGTVSAIVMPCAG